MDFSGVPNYNLLVHTLQWTFYADIILANAFPLVYNR